MGNDVFHQTTSVATMQISEIDANGNVFAINIYIYINKKCENLENNLRLTYHITLTVLY